MDTLQRYKAMSDQHCLDCLHFLHETRTHFSIFCSLAQVYFDPPLPEEQRADFGSFVLFVLAGYTFESLKIYPELSHISFEAGLGDNFETTVKIALEGIVQIIVKDKNDSNVVLFNRCDPHSIFADSAAEALQSSKDAILSDPRNQEVIATLQKEP
ncbi:hypothetical protein [Helicobacter ailurogastricus]|uniref:Uncharacterized protein n=1 Tax=Helicobacter ailurogastricus TaxID=1578720 RepID=A0A0K2XBA5_9HELI|nr:hypothetical protein [Helicobacter ailurogastricus]CRF41815.1 FIG00710410: hypothetical protein [Helicobacter ailurogastricus]CRF43351.1 FIG00710410: hypothetical protein [Helicobacter ailurogastricus]CRF45045.1 FIG00710410: hypothetical protein [Helicobacter ailurogastricus]CRF52288.1 hypothetical protein HAL07_04140 [Helicobacter ailurogastricus]BDQ29412.1 hypothetical protein ASB7_12490 [Helicobacter ailurogastricus]